MADGGRRIADDKLRGMKEKMFHAQSALLEKEKAHQELLNELVEVRWRTKLAEDKYKTLESKYVDFQVEKAIRVDLVNRSEQEFGDLEAKKELEELKSVVNKYKDYRKCVLEDQHVLISENFEN